MTVIVGIKRLPLLTELLLCQLLLLRKTTDFLLLLANLFLLHPGSSVTGLSNMALNLLLLTWRALHQKGLTQAGLCSNHLQTGPTKWG